MLSKSLLLLIQLLIYNIVFNIFTYVFSNISLKRDLRFEHTTMLSANSKFHTTDLFVGLEQMVVPLSQIFFIENISFVMERK